MQTVKSHNGYNYINITDAVGFDSGDLSTMIAKDELVPDFEVSVCDVDVVVTVV